MINFDYPSFVIGFCLGIIVLGFISDKVYKAQNKRHEEILEATKIQVDTKEAEIEKLEAELSVQKNVLKTLSDNNQRLLKSNKQLKKAKRPNDETIAYMVCLYDNWYERSQEEYHLSPSEFIKNHWQ